MEATLLASATALAAQIRGGQTTSRAVVDAHIAQIEALNPTLNAVVAERYGVARAEADAADQALAAGRTDLPPLHGVPCTIKECFAVVGMPQTSGLVARRDHEVTADAVTVQRLRAAGAIVLGVTNTSELCMWMETNNRLYGRTNNPYDPDCIVGGSSGGEGAIVGGGGVPFGLGADIGGSIRMPAFFNGVFGHKPSGGLVPGSGQWPIAEGDALRYLTTGPLCRRAEDLWPLLQILAGPDGEDTGCRAFALGDPADVALAGLRVLSVPDNGTTPVHPELRDAQARVARWLRDQGADVQEARFDGLKRSFDIWSSMLATAESSHKFRTMLGFRGAAPLWLEFLKWATRTSDHTLPAIILALVDGVTELTPGRTRRFVEAGRALQAELVEAIGDGVMLFPSYVRPAPRHYRPLFPPFNWVYTAILNVMELPSTQVPLGLGSGGLPLGVQVASVPGADHRTIAVALALEGAFGGWVPPWQAGGNAVRGAVGAAA